MPQISEKPLSLYTTKNQIDVISRKRLDRKLQEKVFLILLDWIASQEIVTIMWTLKDLAEEGHRLCLLVDSPVLLKTFETTQLDQLVSIYASKEEIDTDLV